MSPLTRSPHAHAARLAVRGWFAIALCALMLALIPAWRAEAHSYLRTSDPADGAVLRKAPAQVTLTFSDDLLPGGAAVTAAGPDGTGRLPAQVDGRRLTAAWPPSGGGKFTVTYRVASVDGHVMSGQVRFRIKDSSAATEGAQAPRNAERTAPVTDKADTAQPADSAAASAAVAADPTATDPAAPAAVPAWVWLVGVAAAFAAIVGFLAARRSR